MTTTTKRTAEEIWLDIERDFGHVFFNEIDMDTHLKRAKKLWAEAKEAGVQDEVRKMERDFRRMMDL